MVIAVLALAACAPAGGTPEGAASVEQAIVPTTAPDAAVPDAADGVPRGLGKPSAPPTVIEPDPEPAWIVGAEPLPLRSDGLGEILPTPEVLVDRSLPTISSLAPPASDEFESAVRAVDDALLEQMGPTWSPQCPVPPTDLRYINVSFWGFDGGHHTGELVVHADVADDIVWVFEQLHDARFPIEEMRLITGDDLDIAPTGDGNNTAAFICRPMRGSSTWSEHARGLALDINPFNNPYVRGDVVLPERASAYLDRDWHRPGMIHSGDVVTEAFAAIGWTWGGDWSSPDIMHFSRSGR